MIPKFIKFILEHWQNYKSRKDNKKKQIKKEEKWQYSQVHPNAYQYLSKLRNHGLEVTGYLKINRRYPGSFDGADYHIRDKHGTLAILSWGDEFEFQGIDTKRKSAISEIEKALEGLPLFEHNSSRDSA